MPTSESRNAIEKLLQDRAQFVSWLTRLNSAGGEAPVVPEAVRGRVRADYERRLEAVLEELRGHTNALEEQVAGLVARAGELTLRESQHKEHLSEAEVRHMVGEYDETKWDGIRSELLKVLAQVHEELRHTNGEVDRLNEVLATIRTPVPVSEPIPEPPVPEPVVPAPAAPPIMASGPRPAVTTSGVRPAAPPEPPPPAPPAPAAAPPASEPVRPAASAPPPGTTEIPFRATPPKPAPRVPAPPPAPKKEEQPGRTLWFPSGKPSEGTGGRDSGKLDELAFLKSVTGNEPPAAPPAAAPSGRGRASGGFTRTPEPPAAEPPPEPKAPTVDPAKDRGSAQKTLKCAECGTLNRPTEWYCERCGAELAAL